MAHMQDHYDKWLRDAYAMEEQSLTMLTAQFRRIENYPQVKARIEQHLVETQGHVRALQEILERRPTGGVSRIKGLAGKLTATAQGLGGALTQDEIVKGALADYAFEHAEIGAYRVLIAAADELGEEDAKVTFERILAEEVAMAEWLASNLDDTTRLFLMRDERQLQASR